MLDLSLQASLSEFAVIFILWHPQVYFFFLFSQLDNVMKKSFREVKQSCEST